MSRTYTVTLVFTAEDGRAANRACDVLLSALGSNGYGQAEASQPVEVPDLRLDEDWPPPAPRVEVEATYEP